MPREIFRGGRVRARGRGSRRESGMCLRGGGAGWAESTRGPLPPVAAVEVILGGEACGRGGAEVGGDVAPGKRRGGVRVVIAGGG